MAIGYANQGLEIWGYPFQIPSGYKVGFRPVGSTTTRDGFALLRRVDCHDESTTRTYIRPDYLVRETIFVPLDELGAIITYQVEGARQVDVVVQLQPVMNPMWPCAVDGQFTQWSSDVAGYLITEQEHGYSAAVASSDTISHDDRANARFLSNGDLELEIKPGTAAGPEGYKHVSTTVTFAAR